MPVEAVCRSARQFAPDARAGDSAGRFYKEWKADKKIPEQTGIYRGETDDRIEKNIAKNE
jgi:hypothetical protein